MFPFAPPSRPTRPPRRKTLDVTLLPHYTGERREYEFESERPDVDESARVSRESTLAGDATVTPLSETTLDPDEIFETYHSSAYTDLAGRYGDLFP